MSQPFRKVLFLLPYPVDTVPAQRLKFEQYFSLFKEQGYKLEYDSFINESFYKILYKRGFLIRKTGCTLQAYFHRFFLLRKLRQYDAVYLFQWGIPYGPVLFEYFLFRAGVPVIYDIDDPVFLPHASEANWFLKYLKNPARISYTISHARITIVTTDFLAAYARLYTGSVKIIPTTIDTKRFTPKSSYGDETCVTIGWSGSHSTLPYLKPLEKVFQRLAAKYPHIRIKVVGTESYAIKGLNVLATPWSSEKEEEIHRDIDIGVYPLPDIEWVQGKFGGKTLIYMAMGIPVVAQRTPNNKRVIQEDVTGLLVQNDEEWFQALSRLIEDKNLRRKMGEAGRMRVESHYSVQRNASKYFEVLDEVTGRKSPS